MIRPNPALSPQRVALKLERFWGLSAQKIQSVEKNFDFASGAPVFTFAGRYISRGWTDWTLGFQVGSALLQYDATGEGEFLEIGLRGVRERMESHLTHMGVHDHGFNTVSSFGNLRRLMLEGRIDCDAWMLRYTDLAIKCSAAVQARRWTQLPEKGFIYSFNGPHSLFSDTLRSLRVLGLGHQLGHRLLEENDRSICLLDRLIDHALTTARFNVYYGTERDLYDVRGRVAHESLFNIHNGSYRCPSTQQGYSPRSTWTRGLAWILLGYAEQLEFLESLKGEEWQSGDSRTEVMGVMQDAAEATADFYIDHSPSNGIPYWDTGAPDLSKIPDYLENPAEPLNDFEPVDSSAASIAAQGLLRLGRFLSRKDQPRGERFWQAGLTVVDSLLESPYLSEDPSHEGLILHSVYHRPNGWDYVPPGRKIPSGEASMWGDYHAREVALYLQRIAGDGDYLTFWGGANEKS